MLDIINLVTQAKIDIKESKDINTLELVRVKYLGKKGYFSQQVKTLKSLTPKERSLAGAVINQAKKTIQNDLIKHKKILKQLALETQLINNKIDISLPGRDSMGHGGLHPISYTITHIENFFSNLGFLIINGPEVEDKYNNFDALNIPKHHPARNDQDTFWFDTNRLLRTQTSSIQIRIMKSQSSPIRIISSGKVYRKDYDQTHTPMFHQIEGLIIDTNVSFANLKNTLNNFLNNFFKEDLQVRFRPSYFPFTEPSAEVDIMGINGNWLETLGCGMVHPNVLHNVNIDPEIYSGFAFGIGIERLIMLRYGITDLRTFFENDLRFLKQFN